MRIPWHRLIDSVTVTRDTYSTQANKSLGVASTATAYTALPCRLQDESGSQALQFGVELGKRLVTLFVPAYTEAGVLVTIQANDKLVVTRANGTSSTLRAIGAPVNEAAESVLFTVAAEEIRHE